MSPARTAGARIATIDVLRGLAMVVMALDHVRDFIHRGAMTASPTDLASTTPLLFATRWITHFCAPTFALTAGIGAFLWWRRGRSRAQLSRFLVSRGLWLVMLELVAMRLAYYFSWSPQSPVLLLVLWSLGLSMVILAGAVWAPRIWLGPLALAILLLHPLLDAISARAPALSGALALVHQVGAFKIIGAQVLAPYPIAPWLAMVLLGFWLGPLFAGDAPRRRRWFMGLAAGAIVTFLALRAVNQYGDPAPWSLRASPLLTVMSFLNVTKYPASPDFALMTLGVVLASLAGLDFVLQRRQRLLAIPATLGQVPLFYYLLHFFVAHLIATGLALVVYKGRALDFVFTPYPSMGGARDNFPIDFGFGLGSVYLVWLAVLALCYPLCRHYARFKASRRDAWLGYL